MRVEGLGSGGLGFRVQGWQNATQSGPRPSAHRAAPGRAAEQRAAWEFRVQGSGVSCWSRSAGFGGFVFLLFFFGIVGCRLLGFVLGFGGWGYRSSVSRPQPRVVTVLVFRASSRLRTLNYHSTWHFGAAFLQGCLIMRGQARIYVDMF